jgi:YbgC/YbaW family acyl-CoA thioester hydrolase
MSFQRQDFRCVHRLRVRWAEVDMQKIVFNAHYLMYFDTAMADYWRALALPYESSMHALGGDLYVKKASVEYFASARYDDQLDVGLRCARIGNSSIAFEGAIFRGDTLLVTGELLYVYANPATQKSQPVPIALRSLLESFEAGKPVTESLIATWDVAKDKASAVRQSVFVDEQGVDAGVVWDGEDAHALHGLLLNAWDAPVACGRLTQHASGVGRIGRMAVDRVLRGSHLGQELVVLLLEQSRARGDHSVLLHAQCSAVPFWQSLGFLAQGDVFQEAGIDHVEMVLQH